MKQVTEALMGNKCLGFSMADIEIISEKHYN